MPNWIMTAKSDETKPGLFVDLSLLEWRLFIVLQWQINNGKRVEITNSELVEFTGMDRDQLRHTRAKLMVVRKLIRATRANLQGTSYIYEEAMGADGQTVTGKPLRKNVITGHRRKSKEPDETKEIATSEQNGTRPVDT
jgi:hypothetical protein